MVPDSSDMDRAPLCLYEAGRLASADEICQLEKWLLSDIDLCKDIAEFAAFVHALRGGAFAEWAVIPATAVKPPAAAKPPSTPTPAPVAAAPREEPPPAVAPEPAPRGNSQKFTWWLGCCDSRRRGAQGSTAMDPRGPSCETAITSVTIWSRQS